MENTTITTRSGLKSSEIVLAGVLSILSLVLMALYPDNAAITEAAPQIVQWSLVGILGSRTGVKVAALLTAGAQAKADKPEAAPAPAPAFGASMISNEDSSD